MLVQFTVTEIYRWRHSLFSSRDITCQQTAGFRQTLPTSLPVC